MATRKHYIQQALESFSSLSKTLDELTEEEVLACLELEASSRRRQSILDRLISRAVRLNELLYNRQLKDKFHGTRSLEDHVRR
jgi:hypothetical protein